MKFGISYSTPFHGIDPDGIVAYARHAEECGFESRFDGRFFAFDGLCQFPKPRGGAPLPFHVGGSSRAAARRAGLRGDGYFPGGALGPDERAVQMDIARSAAAEAGRDPETLEYTRSGSIDMTAEQVEALAAQGVTRVVVSATATDPDRQREEMSAFARRFALL